MPNNIKPNQALIVNTDSSDKPGQHWIAISIGSNGKGKYFDSYGLPPLHHEFNDFLSKHCPNGWVFNDVTLQCLSCVTCGHYCVAYIKFKCLGHSLEEFTSIFAKDSYFNDDLIKLYISL